MFGIRRLDLEELKYRMIARNLHSWELQGGWEEEDLEAAVVESLLDHKGVPRFLGFYSREGMHVALGAYGIWDRLLDVGHRDWTLEMNVDDPYHHELIIRSNQGELLLLLRAGILDHLSEVKDEFFIERRFLHVEWLHMQDPRNENTLTLLPGQEHPGLGIGRTVMLMLMQACYRLHLDGIMVHPNWAHNAVMYHRRFRFVDPEAEGSLRSLYQLVKEYSLYKVAWGIEAGAVYRVENNSEFVWAGAEMVYGAGSYIAAHFGSDWYRERRQQVHENNHYRLDLDKFENWMSEQQNGPPGDAIKSTA